MLQFSGTFHQSLAVSTVILNELCAGIGVGWTAPTLTLLQQSDSQLPLTLEECSWIASLEHFSKIFGALLSAFLLDIIGRKPILILCSLVFFLQWPLILCVNSVLALYISKIAFGVAGGLNDGTNSVYLGEITSPQIRGIFGSIAITTYFSFMLIELIIATYLSYRTTAIINAALCFFAVLSVFWMREPAQFLLMKGKNKQAEDTFMWLKGGTDTFDVRNEFERIKQNVSSENLKRTSIHAIFTSTANYKSLFIIFTIYALVASFGYFPIISYASMFFTETDSFSSSELTVLLGISQFAMISVSSYITDRFDRRTILIASYLVITLSHTCSALLYYIHDNIGSVPCFPWLIFFSISVFISMHAFMYPALFLIRSELFPLSIKATGGCLSIIGHAVFSFVTTKIFLYIFAHYGLYLNFVLFAIISVVLVFFVYFFLPETRNKSLIEIQENLEMKKR